ncbi:MAG TPA: hypothetical protein VIZ69_06350, partial [Thermoanaerobaculia bacterium]
MRRVDIRLVAAFILCAGAAGCSASRPAAPQPSPESRAAEARARCRGTLAIETVPISQRVRKSLGLPDSVKGALVQEVLPGGPGAAAGIRPNDVVQEVGPARITTDCQFVDAAYGRSCAPVRVVLWRAGSVLEIDVAPVDQDAFLESSCRGGTAGGCFRLAWALWARNEGTGRERALELYHAACQGGYAEACAHEGLHRMNAPDTASEAVQVLERACELGSGSGCAHLAFLYATGKTVAKNDRRAAALYVTSCDRGDARGCYNVGLMAEEGRGGARDLSRAAAKYQEACDSGSSAACTNLGFLYENGRGVRKDA